MLAQLSDPTVLNHGDAIGHPHGGKPVADDDRIQPGRYEDYIMTGEQSKEYGIIDDVIGKRA